MTSDYVVVFLSAVVAGGWAIPAGLLLGLPPVGVYVTAVMGSLVQAGVVLGPGGRLREWAVERYFQGGGREVAESRAARLVDRWGAPGLATIGATVLGPTATLVAALVLGVDRRRFLVWYVAGTTVGFVLVLVFWLHLG